jgi:superfamily I DNA and/or RNA helicase
VSSGYVSQYTDYSLIQHELSKKKRHIPIRQLVQRAADALQALKPCFMMSPQSVAQYLDPQSAVFDVVLMDEASQLRLEDSLGAIARSNQAVIVGDPKQLPPTIFFERLLEGDLEADDITAAEEGESILDVCQTCFQNRRLKWHYRSEHEQLIAFSNSEFYENDLVIFPSAFATREDYGVKHHFVQNALYQKGKNRAEAEAVAAAIMDHFIKHSKLSLGVATFNLEQRDLIQDELERLQKRNPRLEELIKSTEDSDEPFFIKNLENVQGDERDVIFISTTYGPDVETPPRF